LTRLQEFEIASRYASLVTLAGW